MRKILAIIAFILASNVSASNATFKKFVDNLQTLSADFQQNRYDVNGALAATERGSFILKRPNRLYWQVMPPNEQIIAINDEVVWFYDVLLEQASTYHLTRFKTSPLYPLLNKNTTIDAHFVKKQAGLNWFLANHESTDNQQIAFGFDNFQQLKNIRLSDGQGVLEIVLDNVIINQNITDDAFLLNLAPTVDVINNQ